MTPFESSTVESIRRGLKRTYGARLYVDKTTGDAKKSGRPDLMGIVDGTGFGIEVKAPGAKRGVTARQRAELARIRRAGGIAIEARSIADVLAAFRQAGIE